VKQGYFRVEPVQPNIFATATMAEIVDQLELCGYRCEAGALERNIAFIELKRRSVGYSPRDVDRLREAVKAARAALDYIVERGEVPPGEVLAALEDALKAIS